MLRKFFSGAKKQSGWMAIRYVPEGLCLAHVQAHGHDKPLVTLCGVTTGDAKSNGLLTKAAKEMQLARYHCSTLLAPNEYQMLVVEAPNVPAPELKTAMRWRIKDLLDFHIDDATLDVLDIPPEKNNAVGTHSMYAIAARNSVIEQRINQFHQSNIALEVIDIPEMAQRNISARVEDTGRGLALMSFTENAGLLTVTYQGELYLARHLDIGWEQLAQGDANAKQAQFDRITLELQRSLDNLERQFKFISISRLLIAHLPDMEGLRNYLAQNLSVSVTVLDLNDIFDFSRVPAVGALNNQARFFLTLGAALRHEERAL